MVDMVKFSLIIFSLGVNTQLVSRILQRKHIHTVFNLGYCFYFTMSSCVSLVLFYEYGSLFSQLLEFGLTELETCYRLGLARFIVHFVAKVFVVNLIFRYVIVKYSHYGMGKMGVLTDINGWTIKVLYFTLLLSYGFMGYLGLLLIFIRKESTLKYVQGRICLLQT